MVNKKQEQRTYDFNEQSRESYKTKEGWKDLAVSIHPKYRASKEKAIELISSGKYGLDESDFWILKNASGTGEKMKLYYTGLIISHNGCLKINDKLDANLKFKPSAVSFLKDQNGDKVMQYVCDEQGIYEFGEITPSNCKNDYPYAMVLKRLMDRVILKNSKVGFFGIYSDSESEDFKQSLEDKEEPKNDFGISKNLSDGVDEDLRDAKETHTLNKLKEAMAAMGSVAEIEGYLEYKHNGKTRLQKLESMLEANRAQAMLIIERAKKEVGEE